MLRLLNINRVISKPRPTSNLPTATPIRSFHKHYNALREEQTFQLSDGRTIGFAEYGDLNGTPLFFLHGSPGSRYDGSGFIGVAERLKIHIVSPDRPGHGLSSFHKGQKLGDYAGDIRELAQHLKFSKYHVMGGSGGGPYAVACAHGIPQDQLISTAVVAGGGPPETTTIAQSGLYTVIVSGLARHAPNVLGYIIKHALTRKSFETDIINGMKRLLPPEDQVELDDPMIQAMTVASIKEAYAQGPDGVIQDSQLSDSPWDFHLKDVKGVVKLFYGHKDTRTPVGIGRYYEDRLPTAELFEFEDAGHVSIWTKYEESILKEVLGSGPLIAAPEPDLQTCSRPTTIA